MAASAFFDSQSILLDDEKHSNDEDRFILIGLDKLSSLLIVCHCYRYEGQVVRIISARKADKQEAIYYSRRNGNDY